MTQASLALVSKRRPPNQITTCQSVQQHHECPEQAWLREHWGALAHCWVYCSCFLPTMLKCQLPWKPSSIVGSDFPPSSLDSPLCTLEPVITFPPEANWAGSGLCQKDSWTVAISGSLEPCVVTWRKLLAFGE